MLLRLFKLDCLGGRRVEKDTKFRRGNLGGQVAECDELRLGIDEALSQSSNYK